MHTRSFGLWDRLERFAWPLPEEFVLEKLVYSS